MNLFYDYVSYVTWRNENVLCVYFDVLLSMLHHLLLALIMFNFFGAYEAECKRLLLQATA